MLDHVQKRRQEGLEQRIGVEGMYRLDKSHSPLTRRVEKKHAARLTMLVSDGTKILGSLPAPHDMLFKPDACYCNSSGHALLGLDDRTRNVRPLPGILVVNSS